jgi:hypothetical protein
MIDPRREQGAMLIELLVAVVILSVVAVGIGSMLAGTARLETVNQAKNRLSATVESLSERLRSDTAWMETSACTVTVGTSSTCDVAWMFDGSGAAPYDTPHPNLTHPSYGEIGIVATARAVDSPDDGFGAADEDQVRIDFYAVRLEAEFVDAARFAPNMKPVLLETTIDTSGATGGLALQVCRIRGQLDERMAIGSCDEARQEVMSPGLEWSASNGGTTPDAQAYTCAHPDHYRASTTFAFVTADAAETTAGPVNTRCYSADGPWAETSAGPSYRPRVDFFGSPWYDQFPDFSPRADTLPGDSSATPWNDRYRYVSSVIEPIQGVSVRIDGIAGTPTSGESRVATTDAAGRVRWSVLVPGRYHVDVTGEPAGLVKSRTMSVPGESVTVSQGVESRATQVFRPAGGKTITISLQTVDISYPWTSTRTGWRVIADMSTTPYVQKPWNAAWGTQGAGAGATYTTHYGASFQWNSSGGARPGPWPLEPQHSTWMVNNVNGSPQPFCMTVRAAPWGRLAQGGNLQCHHGAPTTHYTFSGLQPGLYSFEVQGVPGFVWRREHNPGFLWIDETGATIPPSSGAWSARARATYYGCVDGERALARWLFDPSLPPGPCGSATTSSTDDDGGGGTG